MYRRGFTLVEVLITLGVVGIIAALTVPTFMNFMPSEQKVKYIKAHNTLLNVTQDLLSDPTLYYTLGANNCQGFDCTGRTLDGNNISGDTKLGILMSEKMQLSSGPTVANNVVSFTSADNIGWSVQYSNNVSTVTIDIDPNDLVDSYCRGIYAAACTNPDQFRFSISNLGRVTATDALGRAFLSSPTKLSMSQVELDTAVAKNNTGGSEPGSGSGSGGSEPGSGSGSGGSEPGSGSGSGGSEPGSGSGSGGSEPGSGSGSGSGS